MADPFHLQRFVDAQNRGGTYEAAAAELRAGRKRSHWMWFVFPQLRGLGRTAMAHQYGIGSREEAIAYLAHDVLGPRLHQCAQLVTQSGAATAETLLGGVDALKLRSSMTLFAEVADGASEAKGGRLDGRDFVAVLDAYYAGERDPLTLQLLGPS
ncbi:MAG: DUF1810 domain-containing protein [Mycobacterium sp.]